MIEKTLHFESPRLLGQLYCGSPENLSKAEAQFGVTITTRDDWLKVSGESEESVASVESFFTLLGKARSQGMNLRDSDFAHFLATFKAGKEIALVQLFENPLVLNLPKKSVVPKTLNQKLYVQSMRRHDVVFGVGPAGTGKTYLAVACALEALNSGQVERLILTRPAVEAGEALGFLPGDLKEKILPYLRPLYDAMYEMLGKEPTERLIERGVVEIAPLAYMRGRTLGNAFVILDEAQNTTPQQMLMFLTRLGFGSRMVVTGDITQIDLPKGKPSGLRESIKVLAKTEGVKIFYLDATDVVRNPLVQKIIEAYDRYDRPAWRDE